MIRIQDLEYELGVARGYQRSAERDRDDWKRRAEAAERDLADANRTVGRLMLGRPGDVPPAVAELFKGVAVETLDLDHRRGVEAIGEQRAFVGAGRFTGNEFITIKATVRRVPAKLAEPYPGAWPDTARHLAGGMVRT